MVDLRYCLARQDFPGQTDGSDGVIQENQGLGVVRHILYIVGSAEKGEAPGPLEVAHPAVEPSSGSWVQACRRLVQDQEARIAHKGPGNENALLLTP